MELIVLSKREKKKLDILKKQLEILGISEKGTKEATSNISNLSIEFSNYKKDTEIKINNLQSQIDKLEKKLQETQEELIRVTTEQTNSVSEWAKKAYEEMMGNPVIIKGNDIKEKNDGGIV